MFRLAKDKNVAYIKKYSWMHLVKWSSQITSTNVLLLNYEILKSHILTSISHGSLSCYNNNIKPLLFSSS